MSERDEHDDDGPAFPTEGGLTRPRSDGMTLRDYFAAKAMQGLITNRYGGPDVTAAVAYAQADAMLKARKQ